MLNGDGEHFCSGLDLAGLRGGQQNEVRHTMLPLECLDKTVLYLAQNILGGQAGARFCALCPQIAGLPPSQGALVSPLRFSRLIVGRQSRISGSSWPPLYEYPSKDLAKLVLDTALTPIRFLCFFCAAVLIGSIPSNASAHREEAPSSKGPKLYVPATFNRVFM